MSALVLLAISTALSILFIPLAIRLAPHLGMVDLPDEARKVHVKPIPRVGGFGIALGALIPLTFMLPLEPVLQSFVIGALTLFLFGMWDDARQLSHWVKFVGQFFAAGLVVFYGGLWVERFPFLDGPLPAVIGQPFTIIAIVGVINAINHSDGLDGLAGGESLLSLIVMGFLAYIVGDSFAVLLCSAVAGGILGFLRFNTHPAQIFMGDAGSQFLGFSLAFLAVYLTQVAHPALSPALPLLLIGLPIADINAVFYLRIKSAMNWFRASRNHIHHRLLDLGFDHYETVILIYFVQALLVSSAIFTKYESDLVVILIFFGVAAAVFAGLTLCERRGIRTSDSSQAAGLGRILGDFRVSARLRRLPAQVVTWLLAAIIILGSLSTETVPEEFGWISAALFLVCLAVNLRFMVTTSPTVIRGALYAAALFVVYLTVNYPPNSLLAYAFSTPAFITLAIVLAVAIRMASESTFKTNPTDYLIVLGIITIALFGRDQFGVKETSLLLIHSVIILYTSELALREASGRFTMLTLAILGGLGTLGLRGILGL